MCVCVSHSLSLYIYLSPLFLFGPLSLSLLGNAWPSVSQFLASFRFFSPSSYLAHSSLFEQKWLAEVMCARWPLWIAGMLAC